MGKTGYFKRRLTIFFFSSIMVILIIEFSLRVLFHEQLKTRHYPLIYTPDSITSYKFIPNKEDEINVVDAQKKVLINKWGFNSLDFSLKKDNKVFRIFVVGASNVNGFWVADSLRFTSLLEKKFRLDHRKVEVINAGRDGESITLRNMYFIRKEIIAFKPDLVLFESYVPLDSSNYVRDCYMGYIIGYQANNYKSKLKCMNRVNRIEVDILYTFLYDISYIFRAYNKKKYEVTQFGGYDNNPDLIRFNGYQKKRVDINDGVSYYFSVTKSMNRYSELNDLLKINSCKFIVFSYDSNNSHEKLFNRAGIPYINLDLFSDQERAKTLLHKNDGHMNSKCHQLISNILYEKLIQHIP